MIALIPLQTIIETTFLGFLIWISSFDWRLKWGISLVKLLEYAKDLISTISGIFWRANLKMCKFLGKIQREKKVSFFRNVLNFEKKMDIFFKGRGSQKKKIDKNKEKIVSFLISSLFASFCWRFCGISFKSKRKISGRSKKNGKKPLSSFLGIQGFNSIFQSHHYLFFDEF